MISEYEGDMFLSVDEEDEFLYNKTGENDLRIHENESRIRSRDSCFYGPENESKICIWPFGGIFSWMEKSCGTTWLGVYGVHTTCAISLDLNQDGKIRRTSPFLEVGDKLSASAILNNVATDMHDKSSAIRGTMNDHCSHTETSPFAIVSVAPDAYPFPQESNVKAVVNFLMEKLTDCSVLGEDEPEQIAVCALKYLFGSMFKPSEIQLY